ncbi:MAG: hypothetical protein ACEPOW_02600 [Bacteroidales bacterium]
MKMRPDDFTKEFIDSFVIAASIEAALGEELSVDYFDDAMVVMANASMLRQLLSESTYNISLSVGINQNNEDL